MAQIVRLFVLNEQDERVGVFVVDMEALQQMYQERLQESTSNQTPQVDWEQLTQPTTRDLPPAMLHWKWTRDEDGNICLRFRPRDPS